MADEYGGGARDVDVVLVELARIDHVEQLDMPAFPAHAQFDRVAPLLRIPLLRGDERIRQRRGRERQDLRQARAAAQPAGRAAAAVGLRRELVHVLVLVIVHGRDPDHVGLVHLLRPGIAPEDEECRVLREHHRMVDHRGGEEELPLADHDLLGLHLAAVRPVQVQDRPGQHVAEVPVRPVIVVRAHAALLRLDQDAALHRQVHQRHDATALVHEGPLEGHDDVLRPRSAFLVADWSDLHRCGSLQVCSHGEARRPYGSSPTAPASASRRCPLPD